MLMDICLNASLLAIEQSGYKDRRPSNKIIKNYPIWLYFCMNLNISSNYGEEKHNSGFTQSW